MSAMATAGGNLKQTHRGFVVAALVLAMFTAAIEGTIVATAMPTIAGKLGNFDLFSWVFSIFLLTQAAAIPIYGRLADMYGRKPVFIVGSTIFLIGTILCGTAQSMTMLIAFRAVQGIGAGVIIPISSTLVGDLFSLAERARVQGWLSSVWGVSSVIGPTTGGFIVDNMGWQWIFFLNVPLALLAMAGLALFLHEHIEKRQHKIDYAGSVLLIAGTSTFLVFLLEGGNSWEWLSAPSIGLLTAALLAVTLFLYHEQRTAEPLLPLSLFRNRLVAITNIATLATGVLTIGVSANVPNFVQGVGGHSATIAGLAVGAMSLGWPLASVMSGRLLMTRGFRFTAFLGGPPLLISSLWLSTFGEGTSPAEVAGATFIMGLGLGFTSTSFIVLIQNAVDWKHRGIATSANMFMRQMGAALGIAVLGAMVNSKVSNLGITGPGGGELSPEMLLDSGRRAALSPQSLSLLTDAFTDGMHLAFLGLLVTSAVTIAIMLFMPKTSAPEQAPQPAPQPVETAT